MTFGAANRRGQALPYAFNALVLYRMTYRIQERKTVLSV